MTLENLCIILDHAARCEFIDQPVDDRKFAINLQADFSKIERINQFTMLRIPVSKKLTWRDMPQRIYNDSNFKQYARNTGADKDHSWSVVMVERGIDGAYGDDWTFYMCPDPDAADNLLATGAKGKIVGVISDRIPSPDCTPNPLVLLVDGKYDDNGVFIVDKLELDHNVLTISEYSAKGYTYVAAYWIHCGFAESYREYYIYIVVK